MSYVDLRDIVEKRDTDDEEECSTYELWKDALEREGIDIEDQARNEPMMIPDDDFADYAQELAEDIGRIDRDVRWPYTCIDWEEAARELQQDYSCVEVDGTEYWFHSY